MAPPFPPPPVFRGVSGDTLVLTAQGPLPIASLVSDEGPILWNGVQWQQMWVYNSGDDYLRPLYQVTLADNRTLKCSDEYRWYVQNPRFTEFTETATDITPVPSSVVWRTHLPTDDDGGTPEPFPTVQTIAPTGTTGNIYYIEGSHTGLVVYNGILTSMGFKPEGLTPGIPTPTPTPSPTPTPPPSGNLPDGDPGWATFLHGVIVFTAGQMTLTTGGQSTQAIGVVNQETINALPPGNATGTNGTIEAGLPDDTWSVGIFYVPQANDVEILIYQNGSQGNVYSSSLVTLIDAQGTIYWQGQINQSSVGTSLHAPLVAGQEYALVFDAWVPDFTATAGDFETQTSAVQFSAGTGGSDGLPATYIGWCQAGGYTANTALGAGVGILFDPAFPGSLALDSLLFQSQIDGGSTVDNVVLSNFIDGENGPLATVSDAFNSRAASVIDSAGNIFWSGTLGDLQQLAVQEEDLKVIPLPIAANASNGYSQNLIIYNTYALVIAPGSLPPTPTPSPTPSGDPGDPYPTQRPNDHLWLGVLRNGEAQTVNGVDASSNNSYDQDPYFTFELPTGATNLMISLVDNTTGDFSGASGWLMVRRSSTPSSNDNDQSTQDYQDDGPGMAVPSTLYTVSVPDNKALAGEWFVALDVNILMNGLMVTVSWTDNTAYEDLTYLGQLANGNVGSLDNSTDVLFDLMPGAQAYFTMSVPEGNAFCAVVNDNANGDLAAQLGQQNIQLELTDAQPWDGTPGDGLDGINTLVPLSAHYLVTGNEYTIDNGALPVFVNLWNKGDTTITSLRLTVNMDPGSSTSGNTATPTPSPSGDSQDVHQVLLDNGVIDGSNVNSPIQDWMLYNDDDDYRLLGSGSDTPNYIANANSIWGRILNNVPAIPDNFTGTSDGSFAKASFEIGGLGINSSILYGNGNQYISATCGYCPFFYAPDLNFPGIVLSNGGLGNLFSSSLPLICYLREVVSLEFAGDGSVVTAARSFVEWAILVQGVAFEDMPSQLVLGLTDANGNACGSCNSSELVFCGASISGQWAMYVYRRDAETDSLPLGTAFTDLTTVEGSNLQLNQVALANYLQVFGTIAQQGFTTPVPVDITLNFAV